MPNLFSNIVASNKKLIKKWVSNKPLNSFDTYVLNEEQHIYLSQYPDFTQGSVTFGNKPFLFSDAKGMWHSYEEIFKERVYEFQPKNNEPIILDCGANIGLSVLYFKILFPKSKIIAFEPDKQIYQLLNQNITGTWKLDNIELLEAAAWIEDTTLEFFSEGSLAGTIITTDVPNRSKINIQATDLKKYLNNKIDFLKIDIEGAENTLIFDIAPFLKNVDCLFLEYHSITNETQKLGKILSLLSSLGYRYYIKNADSKANPFPFKFKTETIFDLQLNIFCTR